ncbi:PREDICTED: uncharacterized protein LOC104810928 [Tarenaya hassleriana]|uniref:uncharacterized protein LOC104810928 n=1 Tax=Tarenaya hassleriana TaxID=28532 RepID=UPI00053C0D7F|nr:PREDICTED: uncharacterized protein LOC104810928 [Tarenaya hassleriana]
MEGKKGCKIRKRGCSSSSSSSLARKNRFKRAILAGKRAVRGGGGGGSGTPVKPTAAFAGKFLSFPLSPEKFPTEAQNSSVSARKLAATLWEISSSISPPTGNSDRDFLRGKESSRNRSKALKLPQDFPTELSDLIHLGSNKHIQRMERPAGDSVRKDFPCGLRRKKTNVSSLLIDFSDLQTFQTGTRDGGKRIGHLKDIVDSITTSKELVKVLTRVNKLGDDDHHHPTASRRLISALRSELDRARSTLKRLVRDQNNGETFIESHMEEKRRWRRRTEREVAAERKLRQQTERMNKKLGHELAEAKAVTKRVTEELQREKRAKEILEQVCDELVRNVGEDKAEVERVMKEAERVQEEVEKEREMMHIADVLREERVQMKLTEAKFQFEEKNAAVERMRREIRRVLTAEETLKSPCLGRIKRVLEVIEDGEGSDQESDMKSIELNMDSVSKSYKWSYVGSGQFSDAGRRKENGFYFSGDDDGRRSDGDSEDSVDKKSANMDFPTGDREEIDRDKSLKSLRDYIISNVKFVGPSEQWNRKEEVSPE